MTITIPTPLLSIGPALILLVLTGFLVFRHFDTKKYHPSVWQLIVRGLRRLANWIHAVSVGLDQGYAHYRHTLKTSVIELENERVLGEFVGRVLAVERSKVACPECQGVGTLTIPDPYHDATSQCWKCHGEGKVIP